ncbi:hypothetical protein [Pedococcus sp. 5OH_020]|uniref:hypothetical protein n=1 Tax=Pedococcus sp. 5OH_020 TaxID=2989814 RepID=UPI0022E9A7B5|nr:hypothetical protein [Pedococcus sp. 5OH_020]
MGYLLVDQEYTSSVEEVLNHSTWSEPAKPGNACQCERRYRLPAPSSLGPKIRRAYDRYEREGVGREPTLPRPPRFASSQELRHYEELMRAYEARLRDWHVPIDAPNGLRAWLEGALDEEGHPAAFQLMV